MANEEGAAITIDSREHKYDVCFCFRAGDTCHTFTGNLYNDLWRKRIKSFVDKGGIKTGSHISPYYFLKASKVSRISIVVLSENFARSTYCLDTLVQILKCRKTINQHVLPIFYDVDPSDVRRQTGPFEEAFYYHEVRFEGDSHSHMLHTWRSALTEVGNLSGWVFKTGHHQYEYEIIQGIVNKVASILPRYHVFLSFSEDTRYSFTDYLYNAFDREGFKTFMKDRRLEDGDQSNSQDLVTTIEKSRLSIIVFSEKYAYSPTSLDELVIVLDSMKNNNTLVWPIFYKVEPSDIRRHRKSCGEAMIEHENKFGMDYEKLQTWRSALFEVANIKGWHLKPGYQTINLMANFIYDLLICIINAYFACTM